MRNELLLGLGVLLRSSLRSLQQNFPRKLLSGFTVCLQRLNSAYMPWVRLVPLLELLLGKFIGLHACASGASIIVLFFIVSFIGMFLDICVSASRTFVFGWLKTLFSWLKLCVRLAKDFFHQTFGSLNVYVVRVPLVPSAVGRIEIHHTQSFELLDGCDGGGC